MTDDDDWLEQQSALEPTEEQWTAASRAAEAREAQRVKQLFGDQAPYPIPDTETDS